MAAAADTRQLPNQLKLRNAKKELGFGMPPSFFGSDAASALAMILAAPTTRGIIVESAAWTVDIPLLDADIANTFGKRINVFGTPDGVPPPGVTDATNTLAVPGMPAADMILLGIRVRTLVEPESRLIRGNAFDPTGATVLPGSPDVWSLNDLNNGSITGIATEGDPATGVDPSTYFPAEFLWGLPTWRVAYAFNKAYDLNWEMDYQESLIREPLLEVGTIAPFADAEAAGTSFTSNIDRVNILNAQLANLGVSQIFMPITHKRLGSYNTGAGSTPPNVGVFTPSREEDGSPTVFGGIGTSQDKYDRSPLVFVVPVYWPAGTPLGITFQLRSDINQQEMQRWLSVTGGTNGIPGQDLDLPISALLSGPTSTNASVMEELTLNTPGVLINQAVQTDRVLDKGGRMIFQVGLIGVRIGQAWKQTVYQAIQSGAIQAPKGYGTLPNS